MGIMDDHYSSVYIFTIIDVNNERNIFLQYILHLQPGNNV